ncbi:MAG: sodium:alanine symporter family protein, partial [Simkania negevensis]|nr:sodium:alanine symporter family protein [Simkania negevensis]
MSKFLLSSEAFAKTLHLIDEWLWGRFLIIILVGVGTVLTIRLKGLQFRYFGYALKLAFTRSDREAAGDLSQFQALMTALAATIGIGSIAGVATAIVGGGFGAIFWMWVIALLGMATKYAEAILAIKYRETDAKGEMCGGPMYYIRKGLKLKWLATFFAFFGALSALAGGNLTQSHSIADAFSSVTGISPIWIGGALAFATSLVLLGGVKGVGRACAFLVPVMAAIYILGGVGILILHSEKILPGIWKIVEEAFSPKAALGGTLAGSFLLALQYGVARGISSNEAGLGSGPIAAAAAKTDVPGRHAMISMTSVFLSTFVVCTITALVILVTEVFGKVDPNGHLLNGAPLVIEAFRCSLAYGQHLVMIGLVLFGYSTILGWSYYGEKCMKYLLGRRSILPFRILFCLIVFLGA